MSDRPRLARRAVALALAALLLADASAFVGGGDTAGATPSEAPTGNEALSDAVESGAHPEDVPVCEPGFASKDTKAGLALLGVTLTGRGALAVGFSRVNIGDDVGVRRPAAML